ncbi:MAG TPA: hypothetical protein VFA11_17020 [Acidimicrobiales bacterium]|nr:hypothetical protein [Acidimicrobiales bacterium]
MTVALALVVPTVLAVLAVLARRRPRTTMVVDLRQGDELDRIFSPVERRELEAMMAKAQEEEMATGRPRLARFLRALEERRVRVLGVHNESRAHVLSLSDGSTLLLPGQSDSHLVLILGRRAAREQVFLVAATHDSEGYRLYFATQDGLIPVDVPVMSVI